MYAIRSYYEYYRTVGASVIKALTANGFQAAYAESCDEAVKAVLSLVPEGTTVGIPGSVTIRELGLIPAGLAHQAGDAYRA